MQRVGAQPNINATEYSSLPVLLPPLSEQRAIAAVLDSIDEAIERTDEVIAATERLRDALLHELLTRGLPGQHSEWKQVPDLGTIPASWDAVPLRAVLVLSQPGAWGDEASTDGEPVRVLRAADLTRDGRVNADGAAWRCLSSRDRARRLMQDGDLMLERSGGGPGAPVGRVALIEKMGPVYCNNFCQQLRVDRYCLIPHYTLRALWHRYIRGVTARLEHQTTGIRNLDYDGYLSFPIPLPPLSEQRAIAAVLDGVDAAIERAREERCDLRSLQASTADALLTGRIRVNQRE
jgi:type I restriction enzyme S subunit